MPSLFTPSPHSFFPLLSPPAPAATPKHPRSSVAWGGGNKPEPLTLPERWEPAAHGFHKPSLSLAYFNMLSYFSFAAGSRGVMDGTTDTGRRTGAMWLVSSQPVRNDPLCRAILPKNPA